ncbi:MAG: hypothetical protein IPL49_15190 [Saprospirales bacterium]|nr:hypothetical protein [Saprospirales bacterium]MBK8492183.1 hypothetical protein [Saprospirales bacterium]
MKLPPFLILILSLFLIETACKEVEDPFQLPETEDAEYYPLEVGKYWVYVVDSTIFDKNAPQPILTSRTFVKEEVIDTFLDLTGRPWYRIERFERVSDTLPWTIQQVVAATISGNEALRTENDLTFIKLLFPASQYKKWDGNKLFDPFTWVDISGETLQMFRDWEYQVLSTGISDTINGQIYSEVATIKNADKDLGEIYRFAQEKYARNVGLVARELWILDTQVFEDSIPWLEKAEKGFILNQRLIETN